MFDAQVVKECLAGLIGWRKHFDNADIPDFTDATLYDSETKEYYQDKHPALRLDFIKQSLPKNRDLEEYLKTTEEAAIVELLNDLSEHKKMKKVGEDLLGNDVIHNSQGFTNNTILSESRFVGVRFRVNSVLGLKMVVNRIGLQLTDAQTDLKLYLYNTTKKEPLKVITYTTTVGGQFNWIDADLDLVYDSADLSGGDYYLGYYQDDLVGKAIKYDKLNWETGYCRTCDGGGRQKAFKRITKYVQMESFYVPNANLDNIDRFMFDPNAAISSCETNWGFNFNISAVCDLTTFWCDNRKVLKNALALKLTFKILRDMQYSQQINYIEEQLKAMIIRDLEGDVATKYVNIAVKYERALKGLNFDLSNINPDCIRASINTRVSYGYH